MVRGPIVTPTLIQSLMSDMRECVEVYKNASEADRLMPSYRNGLETVRWDLGAILGRLSEDRIRDSLTADELMEVGEAFEIRSELIKNIAGMWGAEAKE